MLDELLQRDFNNALFDSKGIHATGINRDYLSVFKRVAKVEPKLISQVVEIYKSCIRAHRSNLVSSLYGLIQLADISPEMKSVVSQGFSEVELSHLENDEDSSVSGNAKILREIINGAALVNFQKKENVVTPQVNISHSTIGILSQGPNAQITGSTFEDASFHSVGDNMSVKDSTFKASSTDLKKEIQPWYLKWWLKLIIYPLIVTVLGGIALSILIHN